MRNKNRTTQARIKESNCVRREEQNRHQKETNLQRKKAELNEPRNSETKARKKNCESPSNFMEAFYKWEESAKFAR